MLVLKTSGAKNIWLYAFGYFAAYVPYALLTKALSNGTLPGTTGDVTGLALLPVSTGVSAIGAMIFLGSTGLWRRARKIDVGGTQIPFPRWTTWISGACTAMIVVTTTMAYTFDGTSIVTMMLLMRGGVLVLAPIVDALSKRRVPWYSWCALATSLGAVIAAVGDFSHASTIGPAAAADATLYLLAYFGRLRLMSHSAKRDRDANLQFFVEEQLVATPLATLVLALLALLDASAFGSAIRMGPGEVLAANAMLAAVVIGLCSQGTGVFGAMVLLDARESSFSVPVNRASSVLAGLVATTVLALWLGAAWPTTPEWIGAVLVLIAIAILSFGPLWRPAPAPPA